MGQAEAEGENRAVEAVKNALDSPLLNDNDIYGSKHVLLKIVTGDSEEDEISMNELKLITDTIQRQAGNNVNIINGVGTDSSLGSKISVTVIVTGFEPTEEEVELVVGIGEDETLDSISSQNSKKDLSLNSFTEDFSQQAMFDFDEDYNVGYTEDELTQEDTLEDELELDTEDKSSQEELLEDELESNFSDNEDEKVAEDNSSTTKNKVVLSLEEDFGEDDTTMVSESEEELVKNDKINLNEYEIEKNEIASRKREEKLKNISNILRTPSGLTNLIEEPAFKRNGIDLDNVPHSSESEISNHTLSLDEDNVIQLKQNNSFLHDNVD